MVALFRQDERLGLVKLTQFRNKSLFSGVERGTKLEKLRENEEQEANFK